MDEPHPVRKVRHQRRGGSSSGSIELGTPAMMGEPYVWRCSKRSSTRSPSRVCVLTHRETEVGSDPLADVPCLPELPKLIQVNSTEINRWTRSAPASSSPCERRELLQTTQADQSRWSSRA
jgi:hypothetical protein